MTISDWGNAATVGATLVAIAGLIVTLILTIRGQKQDKLLSESAASRAEAAARVSESYTARVVDALEKMATAVPGSAVVSARVKWSLTYSRGDTYQLQNVGDAVAFSVGVSGHPTLVGPDRIQGGPVLRPDEALTFIAALVMTTEDSTIAVSWSNSDGGPVDQEWRFPLPGKRLH